MTSNQVQLERGDTIVFQDLRISFRKTDRLLDQPLDAPPVQHDSHALFPISQYAERVPDCVAANGGVVLELPSSEGMVVTFESVKPYCVRVYTEDANAISGKPVFNESEYDRHKRNATRRTWQIRRQEEEPFQNYIMVPAQKRLKSITTKTGNLRRFQAPAFLNNKTITKHLEEGAVFFALRFDIIPFDMDATNETRCVPTKGKHSTVTIDTPGKPVHFPAVSDSVRICHLHEWIADELGHDLAQEAQICCGSTRLNMSRNTKKRIGDLPKTKGIVQLCLDPQMWYERRPEPDDFCEAPERLAKDKREPRWGWQPDQTVSVDAYLLSPEAASAVLWRPDVSSNSQPLEKHWVVPHGRLTYGMSLHDGYWEDAWIDQEGFGFDLQNYF